MWTPLLALALIAQSALAEPAISEAPEPLVIVPRKWLAIKAVDRRGRRPFRPDAVFAKHLLERDAAPPEAGQTLVGETGEEKAWSKQEADENGKLAGRPGYAYATVESDAERVMLANLQRASTLFVNGAGFQGDMYGYGFKGVPVLLRKGHNDVYVTGIRGGFSLRFTEPTSDVLFASWDTTRADLVLGEVLDGPVASMPVLNATNKEVRARIDHGELTLDDAAEAMLGETDTRLTLPPLGLGRAVVTATFDGTAPDVQAGKGRVAMIVGDVGTRRRAVHELTLDVREPSGAHRRLFRSEIDDSWQYYAELAPPRSSSQEDEDDDIERVVLSLHGAGVQALGQARSYSARPGVLLVAPTNRRPFGFDWQDWGRQDTYEVLDHVLATLDDAQVFVTGHSMGGHGVWHVAANDPDRFAGIAPSAGWRSFDTYGGRPDGELRELWHRADGTSLTEELLPNLVTLPTFILHGEADDNVPVSEAHAMEALLKKAGGKPQVHYQEGAGHWWNGDAAPGADCVDWPGIFELFARTEPDDWFGSLDLDWVGIDPAVDDSHYWITVEQPLVYGSPFRVRTRFDETTGDMCIDTENVRTLELQRPAPSVGTYKIDGVELFHRERRFVREADGSGWGPNGVRRPQEKSPERSGPFKRAFDNRFAFVYGTAGDDARDRELLERARADQQNWWYRANGVPPVVADEAFEGLDVQTEWRRNAILYGNADTNSAWDKLVPSSCPISVRDGAIEVGEHVFEGEDLACVFVYPRSGDGEARSLVGAFGSTGPAGARLGYVLAPFVSGVGYPDYVVFDANILTEGDGGVLAAGWFDHEWQLQAGGFLK